VSQVLRLRDIASAVADGVTALLGLIFPPESVARVSAAVHLQELAHATLATIVMVAGLFVLIFTLEWASGAKRTRYRSRTFAQDVLYALFYQGGVYTILIWSALANALGGRLDFLRIEVLARLPGPVHWILYWLVVDFCTYWWHRMLHSWGPLWAFHSIHHAQEEMSFISSYRLHPFEQIGQNLIMVVPLLLLGVPTFRWLPLYATMMILEAAQHSALDWTYSRAYYLLVSPRFHAIHHSTDPRHHNRNFAKIFSMWDFLFGTGVYASQRPEQFGVEGMPVPQTIRQQLAAPFVMLFRRNTGTGPSAAPMPDARSAS
jgi:sterol desaturase/sphingolipid hydroxylase (fatty acid hydroxylase superfamily)